MTACRQRVILLLAGVLACWYCVGETHGVGRKRFDVRGTVVDSEGRGVDEALVVLIEMRPDEVVDWDRPEHHSGAFVTRADRRGVFAVVDVPASSYYVYARSREGEAYLHGIAFRDDPPPPYDINLSMTEVHGTVFWPDGRTPVADAVLFQISAQSQLGHLQAIVRSVSCVRSADGGDSGTVELWEVTPAGQTDRSSVQP